MALAQQNLLPREVFVYEESYPTRFTKLRDGLQYKSTSIPADARNRERCAIELLLEELWKLTPRTVSAIPLDLIGGCNGKKSPQIDVRRTVEDAVERRRQWSQL